MIENVSNIALLIVLIFLVFVTAVMLSPILFTIYLKKDERQESNEFSVTLRILFIPVSFNNQRKNQRKNNRDTERTEETIQKSPAKTYGKNIKKKMGQGKLLIPLIRRFITSLIGKIEISKMKFHLLFGLDDPAGTGIGYGLLSSVMHSFKARYPTSDIQISPHFIESVCEYDIAGTVRLRMYNLLYAVLYTFVCRDMYVLIRSNIWKT